jgi:PAS domain S-box-containing protein
MKPHNITDRRRAEELTERSEEKFARAFRSSPVGLAVTRFSDGTFMEVNQAAMTFLGYELHEMIGKSTVDLGLWPKIEERQALLDDLTRDGSIRGREINFPTKQGKIVVCDYSAELIEVDGEPCVLSVLLDITERRYMEQALKANEELLRLFVKHTPAAIAMFDTDMRYLQVSDRFLTDYHLEGQQIIGKSHYRVFPNIPDHWRKAHQRILAGAVERVDEDPYEEADGTQGWLQWESLPWRKANGDIGGLILFTQVITERKRAEQALRASEERFANLIHDLGERVKELTALHQAARILQDDTKSESELLRNIVSLLPAAWQYPEVTAARISFGGTEFKTADFIKTSWSQLGEFSAGNLKGEVEVVYLQEKPTKDIGPFLFEERNLINSLAEMLSSALNRRYAQEALRESEEVFRTLTENVSAGIYIYRDSKFIYVNPTAELLTGYSRIELLGMSLYDLIHPGFRDTVRDRVEQRKLGRQVPSRSEDKITTKNGEERWMDVSAAPTSFCGEPAVIATTFDITSRKWAEEELQRSEERYRTLFETAPDAVGVFDANMRLLMTNERGAQLYGFKEAKELIGHSVYEFIAPEDRERCQTEIEDMQRSGKLAVFECTGMRRDETRFDLETRATLIPNLEGQASSVLTVNTDITTRKCAEKALKVSQEQLRALSAKVQSAREEEGTRIAREIHDELGGALTGIKWELETIDTRLSASNGDPAIADVRKQLTSMTGLIESTIDTVRRISSELRPGVLDDLGLVAAIEWQAQQFQKRTGLKVRWETDLETAAVSRDGATAVFRIFQEVLTNILRHSAATNIDIKLQQGSDRLELTVMDDGRGITDDERKNTLSLGLLGMKERALLVGGEVRIRGAEGKGTTVTVTIPLSKDFESEAIA